MAQRDRINFRCSPALKMDAVDALLDKLRNIVELHHGNTEEMREAVEAAFAAIREECATVARDMARQVAMGQRDHATGFDISDAILRTAQPVKAQEGA
jgi:vacuolar-type H+-ATPase subunit D/Vma8